MLNSFLYKALEAAFGDVIVENEGQHADIIKDPSTLYDTLWRIDDNGEHGEEYRVNCPICLGEDGNPDSKHHLYISYLSYSRPVVNGRELARGKLIAHCFRRNCMADSEARAEVERRIMAGMACVGDGMATSTQVELSDSIQESVRDSISSQVTLEGVRSWVPDFKLCVDGMDLDIAEYLSSRGVTEEMIETFSIGWGAVKTPRTGKVLTNGAPWVIVPVIQNEKLVGVQARCPDKFIVGDGLRYWTHPGMRKRGVLYNIDNARALGVGVVCEGVFDVFKVGAPGVCGFGHVLSSVQKSLLETIPNALIMLPDTDKHSDFDTVEEAKEMANAFNGVEQFKHGAHVVVLSEKDPGAMSRNDIWCEILTQVDANTRDYLLSEVIPKL